MNTDKLFIRVSDILGSTPVIVIFGLVMISHTIFLVTTEGLSNDSYLSFISEMAIFIGLLILRGDNIASKRHEKDLKRDLKKSDEVLKEVKE